MTGPLTAPTPGPDKFDELLFWHSLPKVGFGMGWNAGWRPNTDDGIFSDNISRSDPYWGHILDKARAAYGDPHIRFNTDSPDQDRYLVFNDGTRLPQDGTVLFHNTYAKQNFIQNSDGTVTRQDFDGNTIGGPFSPVGYRQMPDGKYAPIDARGTQTGPLLPTLPKGTKYHGDPNSTTAIWTPATPGGDYYTVDPATGQINYFDKNNKPISEEAYQAAVGTAAPGKAQPPDSTQEGNPAQPGSPGKGKSLNGTKVDIPNGMTVPQYPGWAIESEPDIPNQMTAVMARLYTQFGTGTPAQSELPNFPFNTGTGEKSGIDAYDDVKPEFVRIEGEFNDTAKAFKDAVDTSGNLTTRGRNAINDAISTFNTDVKNLSDQNWDGLLGAESSLLDKVKTQVATAAGGEQSIPTNPQAAPMSTPLPGIVPTSGNPTTGTDPKLDDLIDRLGQGNPLGGLGAMNPLGGMNPLGALSGMNPLGAMGGGGPNPLSGGANALSPLADAIKPIKPADPDASDPAAANKAPAVTPITPPSPVTPPPAAAVPKADNPEQAHPGPQAQQVGMNGAKPTVTLPDGKVVEATDPRAAQAAQTALDKAGPGGDPAQKAYAGTDVTISSDGKNPGAKVDPADMGPGDILKWHDKTMVAVAPGLVADPTQPGVTHTLQEVMKDNPSGFQGIFRPTALDPTISDHGAPPPLHDPTRPPSQPPANSAPIPPATGAQPPPPSPPPVQAPSPTPPPDVIPLAGQVASNPGPSAPQAAAPSPFEQPTPPPATRTTRQQRIAAGQE